MPSRCESSRRPPRPDSGTRGSGPPPAHCPQSDTKQGSGSSGEGCRLAPLQSPIVTGRLIEEAELDATVARADKPELAGVDEAGLILNVGRREEQWRCQFGAHV